MLSFFLFKSLRFYKIYVYLQHFFLSSKLSHILLPTLRQIHGLFSFVVISCIYVFVDAYIFLNVTYSVCIILLMCICFQGWWPFRPPPAVIDKCFTPMVKGEAQWIGPEGQCLYLDPHPSFFETGSHVSQASLKYSCSLFPKCWNYRHIPTCPLEECLLVENWDFNHSGTSRG